MSFMVVNSGRAASRAFYLNLRAQRGVISFSRHQLDGVVSRFISGDEAPLDRLSRSIDDSAAMTGVPPLIGAVFHGVRPRLAHPFDHRLNHELLGRLRDDVGIRQLYFPVRPARDVLLSELNRRLAEKMGDWAFPEGVVGWQKTFSVDDVIRYRRGSLPTLPPVNVSVDVDFAALSADIAQRTGKAHSLYRLFADEFPELKVIDYAEFSAAPTEVFTRMASECGFEFGRKDLATVKLNGLANRFLVYNPVTLALSHPVRFRFEVASVIELCDDWGPYIDLGVDCSNVLADVEADLGAQIGLGLNAIDDLRLEPAERALVRRGDFLAGLVESIGPLFALNYRLLNDVYRQSVYLQEVPDEALEVFMEHNGSDVEAMEFVLSEGAVS